MEKANPSIEWWKLPDSLCLKFTFQGYLTTEDAKVAVEQWRRAFQKNRSQRVILVWDCLNMEGYSRKARLEWTHALLEMKPRIASVWLITESSIVKMGASVMALFSGITVHIVKSANEVRAAHTPPPAPFLDQTDHGDKTDSISF